MSLKYDIEEYPHMWSKEIVSALEDYKNGKRNSERKLHKFVGSEISQYYYDKLIDRHRILHNINREKKQKKISKKIKTLLCSILAIVVIFGSMLCTLANIVVKYGKGIATVYLFVWFWALSYGYSLRDN